jgi:transcriptional regulator with XRE-family HTH domain
MSILGDNIRKFRLKKGLTQQQLAELIGVKHNSISDWEKGNIKPNPVKVELLMGALEVSANDLLGWNNPEQLQKDAEALADKIISNEKVQHLLSIVNDLPENDIELITNFVKRLNKKEGK